MGRKTETDEQKVKKVYPDAFSVMWNNAFGIQYFYISNCEEKISPNFLGEDLAWSNALKQINAAKRKKYYKRKITRPNNEKKVKATIMLYPSDRTAVIGKYGSVQKFINDMVSKVK